MFFFGRRKILMVMMAFAFMGLCGWLWRHRESIPFISQPLSIAVAPFEYGVSRASHAVNMGMDIFQQVLSDWEELDGLRRENGALRAEQTAYSEILAENIRLRDLAGFRQGYTQYTLLGGSVIAREYGTWASTLTIDRGSDSGIARYMPVIVPQGLVGFVSEVYLNTARVQLITDPRTSVGAIVQRPASRVVSLVQGSGTHQGALTFVNLSRDTNVLKDDTLVTSGYGGVYPQGLLIGHVTEVMDDESTLVREALVTPAVDFSRLEEVFVITSQFERTMPEDIDAVVSVQEPPMNPNEKQAGIP